MPRFFIDRPVFAWVIAIIIILAGLISIPRLATERFPTIAPPSVSIYATYPGATPETLNDSVVSLIERELSGVKHLLYFESTSDTSGAAQITATFKPGTDPDMAQVDVQNRLKAVEPRLPQTVRQTGLFVESSSSGFMKLVNIESPDGKFDAEDLGDYAIRNVAEELKRIEGVGRVQQLASERAMRVWIDPALLVSYKLTMADVTQAISEQNAQIAPGAVGSEPTTNGQRVTIPLTVEGQLQTPEQFRQIVLRANADGSSVTLGDVARVELGAQSYAITARSLGKPVATLGIQLAPGANALKTSSLVDQRMTELAREIGWNEIHVVDGAGFFADSDHLQDHRGEDSRRDRRAQQAFAPLDALAHRLDAACNEGVTDGLRRVGQRLHDRYATVDTERETARKARQRGLVQYLAGNRKA